MSATCIPRIVLFTKEKCTLCTKAKVMIDRVIENTKDEHPKISFEVVDITDKPSLDDMYGDFLPVITVNEKIVSQLQVDGRAIRQALCPS